MEKIRIGSRGSNLALAQAESVRGELASLYPDIETEIVVIKTTGDRILDSPLSRIGDKGLFTRELEEELLSGGIDMAVHSMKDMPTELPERLVIGAVTRRLDPRDVFISRDGRELHSLEKGGIVATSSLRRKAQVMARNPEIDIVDIRGNVQTRIRKMRESGHITGIILARAGLIRLGLEDEITHIIPAEYMLPAVGQASLAIEIREDDSRARNLLEKINDDNSEKEISSEREFLATLQGGCQVPIAGYARINGNTITVDGLVASLDGTRIIRDTLSAPAESWRDVGGELAERLLGAGAAEILKEIYG